MKNQKGVSMITLIITIIVIIILAAIAFIGMDDATGGAQFSAFAQEFGDYALNFKADTVGDLREHYGVDGIAKTDAQIYYEAAIGEAPEAGAIVPAGYKLADGLSAVLVGASKDMLDAETACYLIDDKNVSGYKTGHEFYGNNLGPEQHFVTSEGLVFTLPGFPRTVEEGEEVEYRMYVTADTYYDAGEDFKDVATLAAVEADGIEAVTAGVSGTTTPTTPTPDPENP